MAESIGYSGKANASETSGSAVDTSILEKAMELGETIGHCWLKTKGDNFKGYQMYLVDDAVIFSRPKSTKYKSLRYELNKI